MNGASYKGQIPDCSDEFIVLQDTINKCFLPALFDGSLSDAELQLFALPTRLAGLGVLDPTSMPTEIFKTSKQSTVVVANATFCHVSHLDALNEARQMHCKVQEKLHQSSLESILAKFTHERQRSIYIRRAIKGKTLAWLNVVPLEGCHFDVAPSQFREFDINVNLPVYLSRVMDVVHISRCNIVMH